LRPRFLYALALSMLPILPPASGADATPSTTLSELAGRYWEWTLVRNPTRATSIGDHRFDDRLEDITPAAREQEARDLEAMLAEARAIEPAGLIAADRLTRSALVRELEAQLDRRACDYEDWVVSANGPQSDIMNLPDITVIVSPEDGAHYVTRMRAVGPYMDAHVGNLRHGLASGRVANRTSVERVLEQLDHLAGLPPGEWPVLRPRDTAHDDWSAEQRAAFGRDLEAAVARIVKPAMARYATFLRDSILPAARSDEHPGLATLPGGKDCYARMIRVFTSLDRTPEEIHALGLSEVARIRGELSALGQKVLGTDDLAEIQRRLRTDPDMHFKTAEEVEAKAREALARARAAIPEAFGILPKAECVVQVMGMHEAPQSTIAYYRRGAPDGSRPGTYMINTYRPETRPRYEAEALAFHESIPGHHLQIAIMQELTDLPAFRRHQGVTAFTEGWGLYTERLADDMGLYSRDLDRIGMLSYDAWRACRLVVDTGLHAMGWSRRQAIDYMVANTVLAENNIENEVDRYIGWPAQALAYKAGQLEILALREEAKRRLGGRFDLRAFHDAVLRNGALALPVLREQVEAWMAEVEGTK